MNFGEKLGRLTKVMNRAALSREVEISQATLTAMVARKQKVVAFATAKKLAQFLEVDVVWLLDNDQDWPPVRMQQHSAVA